MSMNLLLLGTVIGTLGFLTPAYAELWDFTTPTGIIGPSHNYVSSAGTITVTAFGPNSPSLVARNEEPNESGLGLTNSQEIGLNGRPIEEISPGSFIQLSLSNASFAPISLIQAESTTDGETWQLFGTDTPETLAGADLLASCTSAPGSVAGNACEGFFEINGLGNYKFADLTAFGNDATTGEPATVLLSALNPVPGPIVGAGLPGLIAVCGGLIALALRRRRQLADQST